jgi:hypothetical protein
MIIKNKLDRTFGPFGTSAGFFLILGGIAATWFSPFAILLAFVGAFICFTSSSTFVDAANKRVRFSDDLFGIIHIGKWIGIEQGKKIGLKKFHRGYQAFTRGSQSSEIHINDLRIVLYSSSGKEIIQLKKIESDTSPEAELKEMSDLLGIEII